jgi:cellulose synthase/poly-beta-1,6-N-acetylglucosamine synthase-like glycosyltransferase/peptidoglycan/xylan/chitin deacetylase (PgdA/CDA1 family)
MRLLPKPTWILSTIGFAVVATVLVVDGSVRGGVGAVVAPPPSTGTHEQVPFAVAHGAQVVDVRTSPVRTFAQKPHTIALTFDGGPDPRRTAEILAVLDHFHVPATFFVDGSVAVQDPDTLRAIRAEGSELGVRTFSTLDLTVASPARIARETTLTQLAIAGSTGETTYLARPPFSASVAGLDDPHYAVVERLADQGFVSVFSDVTGVGWASKSTSEIVSEIEEVDKPGKIVGLDASQGAAGQLASSLARAIPLLQEKGWTFTTVTAGAGLPIAAQAAPDRDHRIGQGMLIAVTVATHVVDVLYWLLLITGGLVGLRLLLMLVFAVGHRIRRRPGAFSWGPRVTQPVSVIVPAYNEKECIAATIHSLRASDHPVEIIVVDDGSTDETAAIVRALNFPDVRLVRQANGGKPAALNNGIRHAKHDIIVMIDGDTVFEPTTISTLVQPFARPWVGAVSGNAKVANRKKIVGRWQHIEYVIGFNIDRRIQDLLGCMTTIPGAVGAFRKKALKEAGGVSEDTLAEDTDLTMAVCSAGWEIVYEERARAWTEAPTTLQQLWRQRYRWSYGTMQAMWKHRGAILAKGPAGRMGRVGLLNLAVFQVLLPALAPLIDMFLVYGLLALDPIRTLALWGAVLGVQMVAGLIAFAMEKENPLPLLWMPLQQLVYRQMMYAVLIKSLGTALAGVRLRWQKLKRVGDFGALGAPGGAR